MFLSVATTIQKRSAKRSRVLARDSLRVILRIIHSICSCNFHDLASLFPPLPGPSPLRDAALWSKSRRETSARRRSRSTKFRDHGCVWSNPASIRCRPGATVPYRAAALFRCLTKHHRRSISHGATEQRKFSSWSVARLYKNPAVVLDNLR